MKQTRLVFFLLPSAKNETKTNKLTQQNICCKKLLHHTIQDVGLKLLLLGSGGALG